MSEPRTPKRGRRWALRLLGTLALLAALAALWAVAIEPGRLVVRETEIPLANWPTELDGFKVVLITDLHAGAPHIGMDKVRAVVEGANAQAPDLILLGGDYVIDGVVGGDAIGIEAIAAALSSLRARHGVFAVLGNHDNWNDGASIRRALESAGIRVLEDEHVRIDGAESGFWLAGISDFTTRAHDVETALEGTAPPILALTHSPDVFPFIPPDVALTFAGHTHGGQVWLPLLGRPIVPSGYGQRYAIGLIEEHGRKLFVSPGIGTSIIPVRFLVPPEVSVVRLRAG